jgi:ferredoxin
VSALGRRLEGVSLVAKYKIEIDAEKCIGDQACCADAPDTFEMNDDDIATVSDPEGDAPDEILTAAQSCPTDAITLVDADTGQQVWPEG